MFWRDTSLNTSATLSLWLTAGRNQGCRSPARVGRFTPRPKNLPLGLGRNAVRKSRSTLPVKARICLEISRRAFRMFGSNRRRNDLFVAIAVRCNYVQLIFLLRPDRFFPIARIRSDNRLLFAFVVDVSYHQHYSKEHDENYNHGHNLLLLCNGAPLPL
jgi:hypothetical protein